MTSSPLLARPGAVQEEGGAVAAHYGDPLREQRLLAEGAGLVDRSDRDVLAVPGADRLSWLHSLTSQHLDALADGTGTEALVLSPHGHVEHHLVLADLDGTTWADVEPGTGAALAGLPAEDALPAARRTGGRHRPVGRALPRRPDGRPRSWPPPASRPRRRTYEVRAARRRLRPPHAPDRRRRRDGVRPRRPAGRARARSPTGCWPPARAPAGAQAYEALRVEARRPRLGVDSDHRTIPNEMSWLTTAVHLDKGCYRGQETVARVHNLGRPPRRLVLLHLDGVSEVLAEPGTPVLAGTREVGRVGSVVRHYELGVIALALVKQSVAVDAALTVAGSTASIDPDDAPAETDAERAAARERVRAVRSATIGR